MRPGERSGREREGSKNQINMKIIHSLTILLIVLFWQCSNKTVYSTLEGRLYSTGEPVSVSIFEGKITDIKRLSRDQDVPEYFIGPGFIDIQINGYMGVDFSDPELVTEDLQKVTRALWETGVTTFIPTVITNSHEHLMRCFEALRAGLHDPSNKGSMTGFHLEGPYISPVKGFRGAHLEKYIRLPDYDEFLEYQQVTDNGIILVAVAPELDGAMHFIESCHRSYCIQNVESA